MSTEAPPTYEAVMASLNKRLGPHPKAEEILTAIEQLPQYEKVVISEHPIEITPLSLEQEKQFTTGAAIAMSSKSGHQYLGKEASKINNAAKKISEIFLRLTGQLASLEPKDYAPRIVGIHNDYRDTLRKSRDLAIEIAQYSEYFDRVIIPVVSNETATTEQKNGVLDKYIEDAEKFEARSVELIKAFDKVIDDLIRLAGEFGTWAEGKRGTLTEELQRVEERIVILNSELASLRLALNATAGAAMLAVPLAGVIAFFSGPFAPFVILAGLAAAGASTAAAIGLKASIDVRQNDLNKYEKAREELKKTMKLIDITESGMNNLEGEDLKAFHSSLQIITGTWKSARTNVLKIQGWLKTGQGLAFIPELLQDHFNDSVQTYKAMAVYLEDYARATII